MPELGSSDLASWVRLNAHAKIGPVRFHQLLEAFGSVEAALGKSVQDWATLGLRMSPQAIEEARHEIDRYDPVPDLELARREGVRVLRFIDDEYPSPLLTTQAAPPLLYIKGPWLAADRLAVGIVGTRRPSAYGLSQARRLSTDLVQLGFTVVSGLALGIDGAAHRAALDGGGKTIAVMGKGLNGIHPTQHAGLADEIVAQGGCLVSQFAMDFPGATWTFPVRNRIISGLSQGVVVVEGALRSGSMITAQAAADQGRTVFAVPGSVESPLSEGPHQLLRDGARLCSHVEDILEELDEIPAAAGELFRDGVKTAALPANSSSLNLTGVEAKLHHLLQLHPCLSAEEIAEHSGLEYRELAGLMTLLEIKGAVRSLPGNRFEVIHRAVAV